jgi:2-keto-3-deoxy-L-rhamnonate aldolase RhmA
MKYEAVKAFRKKLRANEPLAGLWVTLEAPSITEAAVAFGLDYVVVDAEHGHFDWGIVAGRVCVFFTHAQSHCSRDMSVQQLECCLSRAHPGHGS